jgi:hypothetical protein
MGNFFTATCAGTPCKTYLQIKIEGRRVELKQPIIVSLLFCLDE